jgi:hypothetical protein
MLKICNEDKVTDDDLKIMKIAVQFQTLSRAWKYKQANHPPFPEINAHLAVKPAVRKE